MIKKIGNVVLLGTSHVAEQSVEEIGEAIMKYEPEAVGIELDYARFRKLMSTRKEKVNTMAMIKEFGVSGYLFVAIGSYVQKKVGRSLNIEPGADMKAAYLKAREHKIPTALIDMDIRVIVKRISRLSFSQKMGMFFNLFFKSFKKEYRNKLNFDVRDGVPDEKFIESALEILQKEVPMLYKILIEDRNAFMVKKVMSLRENHEGNILVVVGAGHVKGMYEMLQKELSEPGTGFTMSFTVED